MCEQPLRAALEYWSSDKGKQEISCLFAKKFLIWTGLKELPAHHAIAVQIEGLLCVFANIEIKNIMSPLVLSIRLPHACSLQP